MAEVITDPSFEAQDAAWRLNSKVTFENRGAGAKDGSIVCDLRWSIAGISQDGRYGQQLTIPAAQINTPRNFLFWIKLRQSSGDIAGANIRVALWDGYFNPSGSGNFGTPPADATVTVACSDIADGQWARYALSRYVPGRTDITLGVQGTYTGTASPPFFSVDVDMDLFSFLEDTVAVKLAERAVGEIQTLLAADLETELAAIDADRADTIVTAGTTTTYYKYPRPAIAGGQTHIEIFERGFELNQRYSDAGGGNVEYRLPVVVRVTFINRDGDNYDDFTERGRRLATGVHNVIHKKPTLGDADVYVQLVEARRYTPQWDFEGEEATKRDKMTVILELEAKCNEVQ